MADERPGGRLGGQRPLHLYLLVDRSGSMEGDKIQSVNTVIEETLPLLRNEAANNPHVSVLVGVAAFSEAVEWLTPAPVPVEEYVWTDLVASGRRTAMGAALESLGGVLGAIGTETRALPPVAVLVSDGAPTDDFEAGLAALLSQPWGARASRVAIGIGQNADYGVLKRFASDDIPPLHAHQHEDLLSYVQWVSTAVIREASTPIVKSAETPRFEVPTARPVSSGDDLTLF
ncbi:MAG: VWA domain-containing protein [Acidimicrobiales bacterium]